MGARAQKIFSVSNFLPIFVFFCGKRVYFEGNKWSRQNSRMLRYRKKEIES